MPSTIGIGVVVIMDLTSKPVRDWMLDPDNYRLEYGPGNCSRGGKSKSRYKKPRKPRNGKVPKGC